MYVLAFCTPDENWYWNGRNFLSDDVSDAVKFQTIDEARNAARGRSLGCKILRCEEVCGG